MKRTLSIILTLILCLSMCACGDDADIPTESNTSVTVASNAETEHKITDIEIFASKILINGVKRFTNPLSVKVKNVWVYTLYGDLGYYFTYEFEVKNNGGIMESVYYGNLQHFSDLSDSTLDEAIDNIKTCNTLTALGNTTSSIYFRENEIKAMQQGEELDANSIQEYFLKNYS